ncbi:hypothetical protein F4778DRAFT_779726 [Xylariomycetidae sp. FL2044]|nr:hypothetical protein F4778DRAFT_779726 [Xylariomycetidae sp. FL2044]
MPPPDPRTFLLGRLQKHGKFSDEEIESFKYLVIATDYFSRDDHTGGALIPGSKHYRQDGKEHTLEDVSITKFLEEIESKVMSEVAHNRRTKILDKVMQGFRDPEPPVEEDPSVIHGHDTPVTPYSETRAPKRFVKSNSDIIESLVSTIGRDQDSAASIGCQITFWDAMGVGCRDHTLADVPNPYVRDRVMDYINTEVDEDKRDVAREAVFPDLTSSDIEEYSVLIALNREIRDTKLLEDMREDMRQSNRRWVPPKPSVDVTDAQRDAMEKLIDDKEAFSESEAYNIVRLNELVEAVDDQVDLSPVPEFHAHDWKYEYSVFRSVLYPTYTSATPEEEHVHRNLQGAMKDRTCDQIREMIKLFIRDSDWAIDQFRDAIGQSWPQMVAFLEQKGPKSGARRKAYHQSCLFFKKREILGIPPPGNTDDAVLRERDANRGKKRSSTRSKGGGKRVKTVASKGKAKKT